MPSVVLPSVAPIAAGPEPCTIDTIICDSDNFTILCYALQLSGGLDRFFDQANGNITLFAPTDEAFEKLGPVALDYLTQRQNVKMLIEILMFHTVGDTVLYSDRLSCKGLIQMDNGRESRTVCRGQSIFQKGAGNNPSEMPEIIETDIETCNGVFHAVDEVMLYKTPKELGIPSKDETFAPVVTPPTLAPAVASTLTPVVVASPPRVVVPAPIPAPVEVASPAPEHESCKTIDQLICELPDYSILCNGLKRTGIKRTLSTGTWTIFAPKNEAFLKLPPDDVEFLGNDVVALTDLLIFHLVAQEILFKDDLPCEAGKNLITMANGKDTRTLCQDSIPTYQKGKFNPDSDLPVFVSFDTVACNGVVHGLDSMLIYRPISEL